MSHKLCVFFYLCDMSSLRCMFAILCLSETISLLLQRKDVCVLTPCVRPVGGHLVALGQCNVIYLSCVSVTLNTPVEISLIRLSCHVKHEHGFLSSTSNYVSFKQFLVYFFPWTMCNYVYYLHTSRVIIKRMTVLSLTIHYYLGPVVSCQIALIVKRLLIQFHYTLP